MITIQVLGLDQFVVGRYSRENAGNIAQVFECSEDNISFYAPNAMMFHNGVEQTSWNTLVIVLAPKKYAPMEKAAAEVIASSMSLYSINIEVLFQYYDEASRHVFLNKEYPQFITTGEIRDDAASMQFGDVPERMEGDEDECDCEDGECDCEDGECHCGHHHHDGEEDEGEIFLGDAFEGFDERLAESTKHKN